jgi:hypothetical protein
MSEVEKFYIWMQKMQNKYVGDNERMERAFNLIKE